MKNYKQLVFDNNFNIVSEVVFNYSKSFNELKREYKKFILKIINDKIPLFGLDDNYYCKECLSILDDNICHNCNIKYNKQKHFLFSKDEMKSIIKFLILDRYDDDVIAYIIEVKIRYIEDFGIFKNIKIDLDKSLLIKEDGLFDLLNNKYYSYKLYDEFLNYDSDDTKHFEVYDLLISKIDFVYTFNFNDIESSRVYKYSGISKIKNRLNNNIRLETLICFPIYYKSFEYLVKMELYNLALEVPYLINKTNSFYNSFGFSKKYYQYMKDIDIDYIGLYALRIYETQDESLFLFTKELVKVFGYDYLKLITPKYIKIPKLYKYFKDNKLSKNRMYEYCDYIFFLKELKVDLNNDRVLYPKDLMLAHNEAYKQIITSNDKNIDNKIKNIYELIKINRYKDNKFVIFPASCVDDLINESNNMSNCVRTYIEKIANGECQIYFMRKKKSINTSFVTVEVRNNKVVQARRRFNKSIHKEEMEVLKKFEKSLLPFSMV